MENARFPVGEWVNPAQTLARRLVTIGENRLELLAVEVQEETQHLLHALLMAFAVAMFGLMALVTLTAAIVIAFWAWSPVGVLLILTGVYVVAGGILYASLIKMLQGWQSLSASLEQLKKDSQCLQSLFQ